MAFLRFTRDKRGYEQFALVHPTTNRRGKTRTRVLYWYRTPPEIKVGREPFDESMRRALEAQNPDVVFDWKKILETPIPSAETERWRERRRAEKAEKAARRAEAAAEAAAAGGEVVEEAGEEVERADEAAAVALERGLAPQRDDTTSDDQDEGLDEVAAGADADSGATPESVEVHADIAATQVGAGSERFTEGHRRRRRRRRGRRGQPGGPPGMPQAGLTVTADAAAVPQVERSEPVEHRELSESGPPSEPRESE